MNVLQNALPPAASKIDGITPLPDPDAEAHVMGLVPDIREAARRLWRHCEPQWRKKRSNQTEQLSLLRNRRAAAMAQMDIPQAVRALLQSNSLKYWAHDRLIEDEEKRGVILFLLYGERYGGKTVSACRCLSRQTLGKFASAPYLLSLSRDFSEHRGELRAFERARALVIDDLGGDGETEKHRDRAQRLICERFDEGRLTVITSNLEGAEFFAAYGDGVKERLFDEAKGALIRCKARA